MNGPDFLVLTGFLGSGKTTLLRDFLASPDAADTAVIVNEVGEIGLDGALLREGPGGEVAMAMLSNGCICCSLQSDLALTVQSLLHAERPGARPLRRIVLETSGLSKPGPVLRQLGELAPYRMRAGVVATYDAERGPAASGFAEAAAQWAAAETIIVTKADRVAPGRLMAAAAEAAGINPLARVLASERSELVRDAFATPSAPMPRSLASPSPSGAHPRISVLLARAPAVVAYDDLAAWLDNLAGMAGDRLLRVKGFVRVAESDRPLLVQSVGTLFSPPRPFDAGERESFLVIIGRDLAEHEILSVTPRLGFTLGRRGPALGEKAPLVAERVG